MSGEHVDFVYEWLGRGDVVSRFYWQVYRRWGSGRVYAAFSLSDLKARGVNGLPQEYLDKCVESWIKNIGFQWREFKEWYAGRLEHFKALREKYGLQRAPGFYASKERWVAASSDRDGLATLTIAFDLDAKDLLGEGVSKEDVLYRIQKFYTSLKDVNGLVFTVQLNRPWSFQFKLDIPLELVERVDIEWWDTVKAEFNTLMIKLANLFSQGFQLPFDTKIYTYPRLLRALFSPHESALSIAVPVNPEKLSADDVEALPYDERYIKRSLGYRVDQYGRVESLNKLVALLQLGLNLAEEKPPQTTIPKEDDSKIVYFGSRRHRPRWLSVEVPEVGTIEYHRMLSGYGYIKTIINRKTLIPDSRSSLTWRIFSRATRLGLITREDYEEWIKACLEAFPDPEKSAEDYVKVFEKQQKYEHKPPLWETLLTDKAKNGSPVALKGVYRHIRGILLYHLLQAGLIRASPEAVERIKQLYEEEKNTSLKGRIRETIPPAHTEPMNSSPSGLGQATVTLRRVRVPEIPG